MDIRVVSDAANIVFEFANPSRFDVFVVSNSERRILWELTPDYMHPVMVERAHLFGVSVPPAVADAVHRLTPQEPSEEEAAVPLLTHVTYGEVPAGYSETTKAESLTAGETYALLVFETSGEAGGIHFSPSGG
jgi:hypothetical protein